MTDKDERLIKRAKNTHFCDWHLVCDMEREADTEEARAILRQIRINLCHKEEYVCDPNS